MKLILVAVICAVVVYSKVHASDLDNVDVDEVLKNDRLLKNYADCVLEKGKCTPQGTQLKELIPGALQTNCADCTDKQKTNAIKVIKYLKANKPEIWKELTDKFDPDGEYSKKYSADWSV